MKRIVSFWIITVSITALISVRSNAHKIIDLVVPTIADPRENAILSCRYDMDTEHLYSAKWYKEDQELFRYMPAQKPPGLEFTVSGVQLAQLPKCSQTACDLELTNLKAESSGTYRCEVSTEAPTFRIVQKNSSMTVAALPWRDPLVEGAATMYTLGEEIKVNCTSDPSLPTAKVTWFINDNEAESIYLESESESFPDSRGLSTRTVGLRLKADKSLFVTNNINGGASGSGNGFLRLRCVSSMPPHLPGGPHKRQFTITASLSYSNELSNAKMKLMGGAGVMSRGCPATLLMATALMFLSAAFLRRPQAVY